MCRHDPPPHILASPHVRALIPKERNHPMLPDKDHCSGGAQRTFWTLDAALIQEAYFLPLCKAGFVVRGTGGRHCRCPRTCPPPPSLAGVFCRGGAGAGRPPRGLGCRACRKRTAGQTHGTGVWLEDSEGVKAGVKAKPSRRFKRRTHAHGLSEGVHPPGA